MNRFLSILIIYAIGIVSKVYASDGNTVLEQLSGEFCKFEQPTEELQKKSDEDAKTAAEFKGIQRRENERSASLLYGQELADLQRVVEAFPEPDSKPSAGDSSATSTDSLEVETYAVFESLKKRFKEFKAKLAELKADFGYVHELAAAEESADGSIAFIPTSRDFDEKLEETRRQLTYEEGTLAYDIARAEYELLRGQQLDLNARILAQKRLREFASKASNPQQLDEHFKGEKSSTQCFQEQFDELLKPVADSVEAEFSEEEKLQEDFEKSLYYRNILK